MLVTMVMLLLVLPCTAVVAQSPAPAGSPTAVARILAGVSPREKEGQLFMSRVYGFRAKSPAPGAVRANKEYPGVADVRELFERFPVGGVVYFEYAGTSRTPSRSLDCQTASSGRRRTPAPSPCS